MVTAELELVEDELLEGEVEEYEGEILEPIEPLTATKAKALNKKIHTAMERMTTQRDAFLDLLDEAAAGQIHVSLGYVSWPAYLEAEVQFTPADLTERHDLAVAMRAKGMTSRAIASILNVSQSTAYRELEGEEFEDDTVTSLTGHAVPRTKKKKTTTTTVVEEEEEVEPPVKPAPVWTDFQDEVFNITNDVAALREVQSDDRYIKSRKRIAKANLNDLQAARTALDLIIDDLMAV